MVAEEALKRIERPQLLLIFEKRDFGPFRRSVTLPEPDPDQIPRFPEITFRLCNYGRQVAILRDLRFNYGLSLQPLVNRIRWHPLNYVLAINTPTEVRRCEPPKNFAVSDEQRGLLEAEELFFWFCVIIKYVDSAGDAHETEMLWRYSLKEHLFAPFGTERNRNT